MPDRSALLPNRRLSGPEMRKARAGFLLAALVAASTTPLCSGLAFAQQLPTQAVASQPLPEADATQSAQEPADQAAANCAPHLRGRTHDRDAQRASSDPVRPIASRENASRDRPGHF